MSTFSSLRHELSPTHTLKWPGHSGVQIMCNTSSGYHLQHAVCHLVQRDSSAIMSDRVEIAFILALSYRLKPLTDQLLLAQLLINTKLLSHNHHLHTITYQYKTIH